MRCHRFGSLCIDIWYYTPVVPIAIRKRQKLLTVRTNKAEMDMVQALADLEGISVSEWVRNTIRREHTLAFDAWPTKRKAKR